jgi:type VI secretion system protein ImpC
MSANEAAKAQAQATTTTETAAPSLLDEVLAATKQTERSRAEDLIRALTDEALKGTVTFSRNVTQTLKAGIQALDAALSKQLAAVMHNPDFQRSWKGPGAGCTTWS